MAVPQLASPITDNPQHIPLKMPSGPWAKDKSLRQAGALQLLGTETLYHSYGIALFTRVLGMSIGEATKVCDDARDAAIHRARKEKVHDYTFLYVHHLD